MTERAPEAQPEKPALVDYSEDVTMARTQIALYWDGMIHGKFTQARVAAGVLSSCANRLLTAALDKEFGRG